MTWDVRAQGKVEQSRPEGRCAQAEVRVPVGQAAPGLEPLRDGLGHSKATGQAFWPGPHSDQLPPSDRLLFLPREAKSVLGKNLSQSVRKPPAVTLREVINEFIRGYIYRQGSWQSNRCKEITVIPYQMGKSEHLFSINTLIF